ncbi:MAG TPA: hypothetical protein VEB21_11900 [Terriglobales bacterium]|nr:hypothetical protein [Terriglobales bacterium]
MHKGLKGALLASAVAGLFAASPALAGDDHGKAGGDVKCQGANACKGQSACGVKGGHDCHGQNSCKGKGWITVSSVEECTKKGGKVLE